MSTPTRAERVRYVVGWEAQGPAVHIGLVGEEEEASERVPTMTDRLFPDVHIPTAVEGDADDELQVRRAHAAHVPL